VVSERLGHATPAFTIETYQHVLPGMQADAARVFERLVASGSLPDDQVPEKSVETREKGQRKTAGAGRSPGRSVPWPGLPRRGDGI